MPRFLVALGLTLALLLATAGAGSTASPTGGEFAVTGRAALSGERIGPSVFTAAGIGKECAGTTFTGSLPGSSPTLELTPVFSDCIAKALSGLSVKFVISECTFSLQAPERLAAGERWRSNVDLLCPGELPLQWNVYENAHEHLTGQTMCSTEMPPQQGIGSAVMSNLGGDVLIHWNLHGIGYRAYGFELLCGSAGGKRQSDATYRGTTRLTAKGASGGSVDFAVSG